MKGAGLIRVIKGRNGYLVPGGGYIHSREEDRVMTLYISWSRSNPASLNRSLT